MRILPVLWSGPPQCYAPCPLGLPATPISCHQGCFDPAAHATCADGSSGVQLGVAGRGNVVYAADLSHNHADRRGTRLTCVHPGRPIPPTQSCRLTDTHQRRLRAWGSALTEYDPRQMRYRRTKKKHSFWSLVLTRLNQGFHCDRGDRQSEWCSATGDARTWRRPHSPIEHAVPGSIPKTETSGLPP